MFFIELFWQSLFTNDKKNVNILLHKQRGKKLFKILDIFII